MKTFINNREFYKKLFVPERVDILILVEISGVRSIAEVLSEWCRGEKINIRSKV